MEKTPILNKLNRLEIKTGGNTIGYFVKVEEEVNVFVEDLNPMAIDTILFIHGWPLSHKQFEYQLNVLPSMGFRCIAVDWRGFGQSDKPFRGYTYDRLADDIHAIIDTLELEDVILVGHSTGGAIALRYMAKHGGKGVSKLVLVDAAAPTGFTEETATHFLRIGLNDRPKMMQEVTDGFFFQYITKEFNDWFVQMGLQAAGWSTAAVIALLRDENVQYDLAKINVPTLIMHGVHDKVIPFAQAQLVQQQIPNSQLIPFYYSGHGPSWEERELFNKLLADFAR